MKFKATQDQVLQMMVNAINASKPFGMGVLNYENKNYTVEDLKHAMSPLDLDYYCGRMVKLWFREDSDCWVMPDHFNPEYQSFHWAYPSPESLVASVGAERIKPTDAKVLDYLNEVGGPWKVSGNSIIDRNGKILFTPYTPEGVRCASLIKEAPAMLHGLMMLSSSLDDLEREEAEEELEGILHRENFKVDKKLALADKMFDIIQGIAVDIENSLDLDDPTIVGAYLGKLQKQCEEVVNETLHRR